MTYSKKTCLILFAFFSTIQGFAQEDTLTEKKDTIIERPGSFKIGFIIDNLHNPIMGSYNKVLDAHNLNIPFSFSVSWVQPINDHLNLDFGIETGYRYFIAKPQQIFDGYETLNMEYMVKHNSLNLPFGLNYTIGKKVKLGVSGYITPKAILFEDHECKITDLKGNQATVMLDGAEKYNVFNVEARGGMFVETPLGKHKLRFTGILRVDMRDAYANAKNKKAWSSGLGLELIF